MTLLKAFWLHILAFFKKEEAVVVTKIEAEVASVKSAVKRECQICGKWVEHFVSREKEGTKCHDCAGLK